MSTYNPSIPQPTDLLSVSQGQFLVNFGQLNTQFGIDHVSFNTGSANGDGHHKQVTFDVNPSAPTLTGTMSCMYPISDTNSIQQMTWGNSTITTQMTGPYLLNANGYMFLPGGILVKWGNFSSSSGNGTFTYPSGGSIPAFSAIYQVFLQPANAGGSPNYFGYITGKGTTTFNYDSVARVTLSGASGPYSYLSIGAA
jgi:hypothetical protein